MWVLWTDRPKALYFRRLSLSTSLSIRLSTTFRDNGDVDSWLGPVRWVSTSFCCPTHIFLVGCGSLLTVKNVNPAVRRYRFFCSCIIHPA